MKVAMVTPFPSDPDSIVGGVAGVARYLLAELSKDPEFELIALAPTNGPPRTVEWNGCTVRYVPRPGGPAFLTYWTTQRKGFHRALEEIRPDVVHFQAIGGWAMGCRRPCLLTIHGIGERDLEYSEKQFRRLRVAVTAAVERRGRGSMSNVISISPYVVNLIGDQLRGRVWPIENPIDERFFDVRRREVDGLVLFVGVLNQRKNVMGLLKAFRDVAAAYPAAHLRLAGHAGDVGYVAQCKQFLADNGLAGRVTFLGSLNIDGVAEQLAEACCLVLPSYQETAPLVIEEAMAAGVPVVASNICGMPFMVAEGKTGYLVDPDRPEQIARQITIILRDGGLRASMSAAARSEADERFRVSKVAERTKEVYRAVAAGGAPRR